MSNIIEDKLYSVVLNQGDTNPPLVLSVFTCCIHHAIDEAFEVAVQKFKLIPEALEVVQVIDNGTCYYVELEDKEELPKKEEYLN